MLSAYRIMLDPQPGDHFRSWDPSRPEGYSVEVIEVEPGRIVVREHIVGRPIEILRFFQHPRELCETYGVRAP